MRCPLASAALFGFGALVLGVMSNEPVAVHMALLALLALLPATLVVAWPAKHRGFPMTED